MAIAPRPIPPAVRATQARASDPASSAFVSATAGSGKTHVLVQRGIRLLLSNVPPEKILCITFTKAAAANMAERVFSTLGHWITLDDEALDEAIVEAGIVRVDAKLRMRARELFASALETPTEIALARKLVKLADAVQSATAQLRPHFLCTYLSEVAGEFSAFYNADKVAVDDPAVRARRLQLCARTLLVLETGLGLLSLRTLKRM